MNLKEVYSMNTRGQSALEYLMTYGWALVVIAIVIAALVFLLGQATSASNCSMSPAAGGLGYVDHVVASDGTLQLKLRNDSGNPITMSGIEISGDFNNDGTGAVTSDTSTYTSGQEFIVVANTAGVTSGAAYNGLVDLSYTKSGLNHQATASCTGVAQ